MTGEEFLRRIFAQIDELALAYTGEPDDKVEASLAAIEARVLPQWRDLLSQFLEPEEVAGVVDDVLDRIRQRRREIESRGRGQA